MKRKFDEIAEELQAMIDRGEYTDRLPSEQELARQFNTASATVRKSLEILLKRGVIRKVPYVGTFIHREARKKVRIAWNPLSFAPEGDREIRRLTAGHFKDFDVEFNSFRDPADIPDCDLIRTVATAMLSFSDCVLPLPLEVVEKYHTREYFKEPFKAHQVNNFHYALPILFSPSLLLLDSRKIRDFGRSLGPYDLTWNIILELGEYARKNNYYLFSAQEVLNLLRCLIYSGTPNGLMTEIDVGKLKQKIHKTWPLFTGRVAPADEETLLDWSCRQGISRYSNPADYRILVNPVYHPGEIPWNLITGEFLLLSNRSKACAEAVQVMEYMLSPDIQEVIAKYRMGLPVLKSAAVDSLNSRCYRDDIFLNEVPNMLVNNASEQEFLLRLSTFSRAILNGKMTEEQFAGCLEYEIDMAHRKALDNNTNALNQQIMELAGV